MTPLVLGALAIILVAGVILYGVRRLSRENNARMFDLGAVSTRWLSELRRDEPWTRS